MNVLVTGATGFFGSEIVSRLRAAGHAVTGASRSPGSEHIALDVRSRESCERVLSAGPFDAVVHAAGLAHVPSGRISQMACHATNVEGTQNVLDAAIRAGVRRFVYISSVMVYGEYGLPRPVTEATPCLARGVYGEAKRDAEAACLSKQDRIELCILRMATMYSHDFLTNIRKRVRPAPFLKRIAFTFDPLERRYSLCSRRNGAEAVLQAVDGRLAGIYNVADRYEYNQQEILGAVESLEGQGPHAGVPRVAARLMETALRKTPKSDLREKALGAYWKYCRDNVYSTDRLHQAGLSAPPDLLALRG